MKLYLFQVFKERNRNRATNPTAHKPSRTLETRCLDAQCTCRTHTAAVVSGIYP